MVMKWWGWSRCWCYSGDDNNGYFSTAVCSTMLSGSLSSSFSLLKRVFSLMAKYTGNASERLMLWEALYKWTNRIQYKTQSVMISYDINCHWHQQFWWQLGIDIFHRIRIFGVNIWQIRIRPSITTWLHFSGCGQHMSVMPSLSATM